MQVTGKCFCGYVSYEATIDESLVVICHCTSCQRHSGTAYGVVVGIADESFSLLSGGLGSYESVADSGSLRSRTFCPKCGTRIHAKTVGEGGGMFGLRTGSVDQREKLVPKAQIWCRSAQRWALVDSLPQYEAQPTADEFDKIAAS